MENNNPVKLEEIGNPGPGRSFGIKIGFRFLIAALVLLALAAGVYFWIAPSVESIPGDYAYTAKLLENNQFRSSPTGDWQTYTLDVNRVDQAITSSSGVVMVEGGLHIYQTTGELNFEATGLYGIDPHTRAILPGYGDANRTGLFMFPPHLQPGTFTFWDPMFIGPGQMSFSKSDSVDGLPVLVFQLTATGLDETAGYANLPDVPGRYFAHTDGKGTAWVEPISGVIVDYEDSGVSYFVDRSTGVRIADFNRWTERFTPETKAAQVKIAGLTRSKFQILDTWLPLGLLLAGLVCLGLGAFWFMRRRSANQPVIGEPV